MGAHARHVGLRHPANDFSKSCRDEIENETVLNLSVTRPVLCKRSKIFFAAYRMDKLEKLPRLDIDSLSRFIRSSHVIWE